MEPTNAAVLTGLTVTVGRWADGEKLKGSVIIGAAFLAVGLAALAQGSPDLAGKFATLIVIVTLFRYGPAIFHKFGLINESTYRKAAWA